MLSPTTLIGLSVALMVAGSPAVLAQSALNSEVAITKIEAAFIESPKISGSGFQKRSSARPGAWLEIEVAFDHTPAPRDPQFAEELTVNFFVLLKNQNVTLDRKPTMLSGKVTHIFVPAGKALHSSIYLPPRALERFFEGKGPVNVGQAVEDVGVTITGKSGLLAISTMRGTVKGDKGWWDTPAAFTTVTGSLLSKDRTPFSSLEWDYYELIKPSSAD